MQPAHRNWPHEQLVSQDVENRAAAIAGKRPEIFISTHCRGQTRGRIGQDKRVAIGTLRTEGQGLIEIGVLLGHNSFALCRCDPWPAINDG